MRIYLWQHNKRQVIIGAQVFPGLAPLDVSHTFCLKMLDKDGAILSIHVRNFLCHENLHIKFNQNINFIIGRNGCGKSAILTALVVGLGARATVTDRGSSLKSFIKHGANSAVISITIKNDTEHAYKHDKYGDTLTVIRVLNASGGSLYKVKNFKGEIISNKHEDVVGICTLHDIQVDNPICILNQDNARNFHAADSKKKYALFRKATNMDVIESNYNTALSNCTQIKSILDRKQEAFAELRKELDKLKAKYEQMKSLDELKEQIANLENEYYWSEIVELEHELRQISKQQHKQKDKVDKLSEKLNAFQIAYEESTGSIQDLNAQLAGVIKTLKVHQKSVDDAIRKYQHAKELWKSCLQNLNKKKDYIYRENAKVCDLTKEVTSATKMKSVEQTESLQKQKVDMKNQLTEVVARRDTVTNDLSQTHSATSHAQNQYDNFIQERRNMQNSIRHINSQLNELSVRGTNALVVYGSKIIDLTKLIKETFKQGLFSKMPRGPIGSYLKVRDKKWTSALEHIIGGNMSAFCVNSEADSRKLFSLMKKIFQNESKPSITTSNFFDKVHDVSRNAVRAPQGYFSALDCLQIEDSVIANFLIDNIGMESILLVANQDEAMSFTANVDNVPPNCSKIVTLDSSEFFPAPNYRSYGGKNQQSKYLQISSTERKKQLESELKKGEIDLKRIEGQLSDATKSKQELSARETELDHLLRRLLNKIRGVEGKIAELETNLKNVEGGHIKVLTEELNLASNKLSTLREEESNLGAEELSLRNDYKTAENAVNELKILKRTNEDKKYSINEEISQLQLQYDRNESEKSMIENMLESEKVKLDGIIERFVAQNKLVDKKTSNTLKLCLRMDSPREKDFVVNELRNMKIKLASISGGGPSKQDIAASLTDKVKQHDTTRQMLKDVTITLNMLKKVSQQHLRTAMNIQSLISSRVSYCFRSILELRGYSGSMVIDNGAGVLDVHCTGRDSATKRLADTTSSLSGGERSYATVAFIMALWDCMELPFYFMDEFDVFMDNVNRKVTMDLLIYHAQENLNRQFVFLTPQDTSTLTASDTVTIHRLADPVRNKPSK